MREIIHRGQERIKQYSGIPREGVSILPLWKLNTIITLLGGRRVGKTYTLIQLITEAITHGLCTIDSVIFIDFAEAGNQNIDIEALHTYVTEQGIHNPVYCFDEVQEVNNFDRQLITLYNKQVKILITGSNSKLLSQDLATILRGRTYEIHQDVLSFSEFLRFTRTDTQINTVSLTSALEEYLTWGGYPEVVLTNHKEVKLGILKGYYELLLYKDLIDRYAIRNQGILQQLLKSLILSHTKEININKLYLSYKSQGFEISKNTLYEYLIYIQQTFFVSRFGQFYKKNLFDKRYCLDNGYMQIFSQEHNRGQTFEAMIYKHLSKHHMHLGFVKDSYEIDFTNGATNRQVCRKLTDSNRSRESAFGNAQGNNIFITKDTHQFRHQNITMIRRDELLGVTII